MEINSNTHGYPGQLKSICYCSIIIKGKKPMDPSKHEMSAYTTLPTAYRPSFFSETGGDATG